MCLFRVWVEQLSSTKRGDFPFGRWIAQVPSILQQASSSQAATCVGLRHTQGNGLYGAFRCTSEIHTAWYSKATGHRHGCHDAFKCNKPRDQYSNVQKGLRRRKLGIFFFFLNDLLKIHESHLFTFLFFHVFFQFFINRIKCKKHLLKSQFSQYCCTTNHFQMMATLI